MKNIFIIMILFFIVVVGAIALQVFLSKRQRKFLGLILPFGSFLYSMIMVLNVAVEETMTNWQIFFTLFSTFFLGNIPTIILLAIYFGIREKMKIESELDKTRIKDL